MKLRIFACALVLAAGCQRKSNDPQRPSPADYQKPPVAVQRGPTARELTAGMVEATTQGKSQTPVGLKFDLLQRPVQGEPLEIAVALLPGEPADPATVEVRGPEALQVSAAESKFQFASVAPAQVYRRNIRLTPTEEGVFLLTLTVNLNHDQIADTRVFSVPIIVAAHPASAEAASGNPPRTRPASPTG